MICKHCNIEAFVQSAPIRIDGDKSPETTTKVYAVQEFICRNPQCSYCGQVVGKEEIPLN